jgi:hypothetical protein
MKENDMAGRISSVTKERLKDAGLWGAFLTRRDELQEEGFKPDDARTMAASEILARCDGPDSDGSRVGTGIANDRTVLPMAPAELEGKVSAEPEVLRWVARNIDNPTVDVEGCPDSFAWTLLRQCRENPPFRLFFIEKLWAKLIPSRLQQDVDKNDKSYDGTPTIELIERIRAIRAKAMGETASIEGGQHGSQAGL